MRRIRRRIREIRGMRRKIRRRRRRERIWWSCRIVIFLSAFCHQSTVVLPSPR